MNEPENGSMVIVGEPPDETVYVRDDTSGVGDERWFALPTPGDSPHFGITWDEIENEAEPNTSPQLLYTAVGLWQTLQRHLEDAHNASTNRDFDAGVAFAANLIADTLHLTRPPWAAFARGDHDV